MGSAAGDSFNTIVGQIDYPMLLITVAGRDEIGGCLVGFASQASISPPRFTVFLSNKNRTYRIACTAKFLCVHFLSVEDGDLAALFGGETGDEVDKFVRVKWQGGPGGTPLLERCPNRFVGRIVDRSPVGDHDAFLLEPTLAEHAKRLEPFTFHRAKHLDSGHDA